MDVPRTHAVARRRRNSENVIGQRSMSDCWPRAKRWEIDGTVWHKLWLARFTW
jgi:hypothetical protein